MPCSLLSNKQVRVGWPAPLLFRNFPMPKSVYDSVQLLPLGNHPLRLGNLLPPSIAVKRHKVPQGPQQPSISAMWVVVTSSPP